MKTSRTSHTRISQKIIVHGECQASKVQNENSAEISTRRTTFLQLGGKAQIVIQQDIKVVAS